MTFELTMGSCIGYVYGSYLGKGETTPTFDETTRYLGKGVTTPTSKRLLRRPHLYAHVAMTIRTGKLASEPTHNVTFELTISGL